MLPTTIGFEQLTFAPTEQPSPVYSGTMHEYEQFEDASGREGYKCSSSMDKTLMRALHGIKDAQLGVEFRDYVSVRRGLKFAMNSIEYVQKLVRSGDRVDSIATTDSMRSDACMLSIQELKRAILVSNVMALSLERSKLIQQLQKGLLNELSKTLAQSEEMLGQLSDMLSDQAPNSWV